MKGILEPEIAEQALLRDSLRYRLDATAWCECQCEQIAQSHVLIISSVTGRLRLLHGRLLLRMDRTNISRNTLRPI